jgi:hypothetical protein
MNIKGFHNLCEGGQGVVALPTPRARTGKGKYWKSDNKVYIYVPVKVAADSQFPFKDEKGYVTVTIDGEQLVITKHQE